MRQCTWVNNEIASLGLWYIGNMASAIALSLMFKVRYGALLLENIFDATFYLICLFIQKQSSVLLGQ